MLSCVKVIGAKYCQLDDLYHFFLISAAATCVLVDTTLRVAVIAANCVRALQCHIKHNYFHSIFYIINVIY